VTGCPSTYSTDENIERVRVVILASQWATIDRVAHHLHIGHGLAHEISHSGFGIVKCVQWVTIQLTEDHKCDRLTIC
jgi:hypothetical protein